MNTGTTLPERWTEKRLKYVATYNDEVLSESTDDLREIDYVEISGVTLSEGIREVSRMTFFEAPSRARRVVRNGDILVSTVRTYLKAIATVDDSANGLIASTGFCVIRPQAGVDSGYIGWVAKSEPFVGEVVARSVGVSYPAIYASELVNLPVPLPPLETQKRIARFLDEKTARIDALIGKKRELLERLAEKRQALITHAVTKGLNPNAPMKPSGIDWLGDIPAHWEVLRLKYVATHNDEVLSEDTDDQKEIDYVEISDVTLTRGIENITRLSFSQAPSRARRVVRSGDILISTVRTYLKSIASVSEASDSLIASTGFCVIRSSTKMFPDFLGWVLQSERFVSEVMARSVGVSYPAISANGIVDIKIPVPPYENQEAICLCMGSNIAKVDEGIASLDKSISLLQEYRSALITAAVTGQIVELN